MDPQGPEQLQVPMCFFTSSPIPGNYPGVYLYWKPVVVERPDSRPLPTSPELGARAHYIHAVMDASFSLAADTNGSFFVCSCACECTRHDIFPICVDQQPMLV